MDLKNIKIFFFGTPYFAKEILCQLLTNGLFVDWVITRPDKPSGRGRRMSFSEVKKISLEKKIKLAQFEKMDVQTIRFFRREKPDLIITAAYGMILPKELLTLPKFGCLNFHASLLPKLRGPAPIQTALLNNEKETGITLMKMDELVDHGKIIAQEKVAIKPFDDFFSLEKKLISAADKMLPHILEAYINGKLEPNDQDHSKATFTKQIAKEQGRIFWTDFSAQEIYNRYRAFKQWPGVYSYFKGKKFFLEEIALLKKNSQKRPGQVMKYDNYLAIQTKDQMITIKKIKLAGKKTTNAKDFINGYPDFATTLLPN
ncbi:MAG: methionyl-tRNA formyltransferase [Candidatus Moranbacteria bacterium]|jgi:methionyl-tRNA formyltransferase|nr:methionyl-tRNA formyltransferase [Candidatus Moranbacteria bacterium]